MIFRPIRTICNSRGAIDAACPLLWKADVRIRCTGMRSGWPRTMGSLLGEHRQQFFIAGC